MLFSFLCILLQNFQNPGIRILEPENRSGKWEKVETYPPERVHKIILGLFFHITSIAFDLITARFETGIKEERITNNRIVITLIYRVYKKI